MDDSLENFLKSTGWSCDDLLKKLETYKALQNKETTQLSTSNNQEPRDNNSSKSSNTSKLPQEQNTTSSEAVKDSSCPTEISIHLTDEVVKDSVCGPSSSSGETSTNLKGEVVNNPSRPPADSSAESSTNFKDEVVNNPFSLLSGSSAEIATFLTETDFLSRSSTSNESKIEEIILPDYPTQQDDNDVNKSAEVAVVQQKDDTNNCADLPKEDTTSCEAVNASSPPPSKTTTQLTEGVVNDASHPASVKIATFLTAEDSLSCSSTSQESEIDEIIVPDFVVQQDDDKNKTATCPQIKITDTSELVVLQQEDEESENVIIKYIGCEDSQSQNAELVDGEDVLKHDTIQEVIEGVVNEPTKSNEEDEIMNNSFEEMEEKNKSIENIRDNLKMQLSFLRNKRKSQPLSETPAKNKLIFKSPPKKKLFQLNCELPSTSESKPKEELPKSDNKKCNDKNNACATEFENDFYTESNELGLVIMNVQGGVSDEANEEKVEGGDGSDTKEQSALCALRSIIRKQKYVNKPRISLDNSCDKSSSNDHEFIECENDCSERSDIKRNFNLDNIVDIYNIKDNQETGKTQVACDKSPFLSNSLDVFLTENSKLNISYNVPKSGAEEGLSHKEKETTPFIPSEVEVKKDPSEEKPKSFPRIKAKTLAEKRKLLLKQGLLQPKNTDVKIEKKAAPRKKIEEKKPLKGFLIYKSNSTSKKIFLKTEGGGGFYGVIDDKNKTMLKRPKKPRVEFKKPSLLSDLHKSPSAPRVKYKPGPLSKKLQLQDENSKKAWDIEMKILPKISLEVLPRHCKPIPLNLIHLLPQHNGEISDQQVEFALSALPEQEPKIFKFDLKYKNNEEKILVRRKKSLPVVKDEEIVPASSEPKDVVGQIIDDLLNYVEIKELSESLIKDDPTDVEHMIDKPLCPASPRLSDNISTIFKKPKRKTKVDMELARLSCKFIDVSLEETDNQECLKPFCQLGCVCRSLKCDQHYSYHCKKIQCMFDCCCPKERSVVIDDKVTLPTGTDLLAVDTLNRLQDQAKKNLAKVEAEFTQTVIHTNNTSILISSKPRRATKTPRRYDNYIDDCLFDPKEETVKFVDKKFTIPLMNLQLRGVIPYCLAHHVHDCFCKGKNLPVVSTRTPSTSKIVHKLETVSEESSKKVSPVKKSPLHNSCARFLGVPVNIIHRNKQKNYQAICAFKAHAKVPKRILINQLTAAWSEETQADFLKRVLLAQEEKEAPTKKLKRKSFKVREEDDEPLLTKKRREEDDDPLLTKTKQKEDGLLANNSQEKNQADDLKRILGYRGRKPASGQPHKRKQSFALRDDEEPVIKRISLPSFSEKLPKNVFQGEILLGKDEYPELVQKIGSRALTDGYARLLPWKVLLKSVLEGSVKVWCMDGEPSRLLINTIDKAPLGNSESVAVSTKELDLIAWIRNNKLPSRYNEDDVSFILRPAREHYEICGLCTKHPLAKEKSPVPVQLPSVELSPDSPHFAHYTLENHLETLFLKRRKFALIDYLLHEQDVSDNLVFPEKLQFPLPAISKFYMWRIISKEQKFNILYLPRSKYSVKYQDILKIQLIANKYNETTKVTSKKLAWKYEHPYFGIYVIPNASFWFVGPFKQAVPDSDVKTLLYCDSVHSAQIDNMTELIKNACWMFEKNPFIVEPFVLNNGDVEVSSLAKTARPTNITFPTPNKVFVMETTHSKSEEFNTFIVTNIPNFGYLRATTHRETEMVDVSWPSENKLLRFSDVSSACDFLKRRFSSLLQTIPEDFQIDLKVVNNIDLNVYQPVDSTFLNGHYVCGKFGIQNAQTITNEYAIKNLGITKEDVLLIMEKRAQKFVRKKVEEFGMSLDLVKADDVQTMETSVILGRGIVRVKSLQCEFETLVKTKFLLEAENRHLKNKSMLLSQNIALRRSIVKSDLISRSGCSLESDSNFGSGSNLGSESSRGSGFESRPVVITNNEPIEILDSDEEENLETPILNTTIECKDPVPVSLTNSNIPKSVAPVPIFLSRSPKNQFVTKIIVSPSKQRSVLKKSQHRSLTPGPSKIIQLTPAVLPTVQERAISGAASNAVVSSTIPGLKLFKRPNGKFVLMKKKVINISNNNT